MKIRRGKDASGSNKTIPVVDNIVDMNAFGENVAGENSVDVIAAGENAVGENGGSDELAACCDATACCDAAAGTEDPAGRRAKPGDDNADDDNDDYAAENNNERNEETAGCDKSSKTEGTVCSGENIGENIIENIITALEAKLTETTNQSREYLDRWQRSAADFENYKRRTQNEMDRLYVSSAIDTIAAFLPVVDSIERAVGPEAVADSRNNDQNPNGSTEPSGAVLEPAGAVLGAEAGEAAGAAAGAAAGTTKDSAGENVEPISNPYKDGLILIEKQLKDVFRKLGVTQLPGLGEQFDPNLHEAIMHIKDEAFGSNVICEVFQKGYKYKDRVVRHSVVKVAN